MLREEIYQEVERLYGVFPECLWTRYPSYAVLRHPVSKKWFATVMDVDGKKLGLPKERVYLVVNVKCTPETVDAFLCVEGFLPAYHMNKEYWLMLLVETLPQEVIFDFIANSFEIVKK